MLYRHTGCVQSGNIYYKSYKKQLKYAAADWLSNSQCATRDSHKKSKTKLN